MQNGMKEKTPELASFETKVGPESKEKTGLAMGGLFGNSPPTGGLLGNGAATDGLLGNEAATGGLFGNGGATGGLFTDKNAAKKTETN